MESNLIQVAISAVLIIGVVVFFVEKNKNEIKEKIDNTINKDTNKEDK